jgi:hypothetical protein
VQCFGLLIYSIIKVFRENTVLETLESETHRDIGEA